MVRRLHEPARVSNTLKGALVGFSATVLIAIAMAISVAGGLSTTTPLMPMDRPLDEMQAFVITLGAGLVPAIVFGMLLGSLHLPRTKARPAIFAMVGMMFLVLCLPFWPSLGLCAVPITLLHALALASWTEQRVTLPKAYVL